MVVASYISPKAVKGRPSDIAGAGLFAVGPIAAGEVVAIKGGHLLDSGAVAALPARLQNSEIQIAAGIHLVATTDDEYDAVMLYLNHSCEPNVGVAGNVVFVTMSDVAAGAELTTDYALFDDCDGRMQCRCGTDSCRGVIDGRDWQRPELQERYGHYFSMYLLDKIGRR